MIPLTIALAAFSGGVDALSASERQAVENGQVIVHMERGNSPVHRFLAVGAIDAPIAAVWTAYTDFVDYPKIFGITASAVRRRQGDTVWAWFYIAFSWPLAPRWTLNETHLYPDRHLMTYRRVDGSFRRYDGELALYPDGADRTRVWYEAAVDPGLPFVPSWVVDWVQAHLLPTSITDVRTWLAGPGHYQIRDAADD